MGKSQRRKRANRAAEVSEAPDAFDPLAQAPSYQAGRAAAVCLILVGLTVIVYAPVRHYGFVSIDDGSYVSVNPWVNVGLTWGGVLWAFTSGYAANWHPLTWLSHMLDVQLYGLNAGPHHLTNVSLHGASTLLLFGFLYRMTGALGRSAFVAGLFAVHPIHVESVAWVAERKDVLSTFLGLLTICAYAGYSRRPSRSRYALVAVLFALALMAKPMMVTLPFVLLLLDYWPLRRASLDDWRAWKPILLEKIPLLALAAGSSVVTFLVQRQAGAVAALTGFPLDLRIANALVSWVAYIQKMLWPSRLAAFYPYPASFPRVEAAASLLLLSAISAWVIVVARRRPYAPIGWLWYVGTLVPVIGLVQVGEQAMADRYSYLPLAGFAIMVSWGIPQFLSKWRHARMVCASGAVIAILSCTVVARNQVGYWENSEKLWEHTLAVTTDNFRTHADLAGVLAEEGRLDEAVAHYSEALRLKPNVAATRNNLGITLALQGKSEDAIREFSEALRLRSDFTEARNNLGNALASQGKFDEATAIFVQVLRSNPDNAQAHSNWGAALVTQGRIDEAITHYTEALRINPDFVEVHTRMGIVLTKQNKLDEAIVHFAKSLELAPGDAESHNNLGVVLAMQGKPGDAVREFTEALRIRPGFVDARNNLTRAQAAAKPVEP